MKTLLTIILTMSSCATTKQFDKVAEDLPGHAGNCICLINEDQKINSWEIDWKNKSKLQKQIQNCRCTIEFTMDEVEDPQTYIKPGTKFYQNKLGYPWDKDQKRMEQVK